MGKSISELKRELASLKKQNQDKSKKIIKAAKEKREMERVEREIKELKRSATYKNLRRNLTKANFKKAGKKTSKVLRGVWGAMGKVVNKLSKIEL